MKKSKQADNWDEIVVGARYAKPAMIFPVKLQKRLDKKHNLFGPHLLKVR